jgi:hypothetical protein
MPDWPILSAIQFPNPFGVKGFPNAVVRMRWWDLRQAASTSASSGCNGTVSFAPVLPWTTRIAPSPTSLHAMRDTSDIRWPVNSRSANAVPATNPIGHRPS